MQLSIHNVASVTAQPIETLNADDPARLFYVRYIDIMDLAGNKVTIQLFSRGSDQTLEILQPTESTEPF